MAFVMNSADPSGMGMFSKAGRFATEKHIIFQKKDEILNDQRKYLKKQDLQGKKERGEGDEIKTRPPMITTVPSRPHIETMSRTISREERDRIMAIKYPPPPVGCYNPRYTLQESKSVVLFSYPKERPKTAQSTQSTRNILKKDYIQWDNEEVVHRELTKPIPDKPKKRAKGSVSLANQTARDGFFKGTPNPHDERFNYIDYPSVSTKSKRVSTADFSKSRGRTANSFYKNLEYSPDYAPDFEFGKKRLGSCGVKFERMSGRKAFHFVSDSKNENFLDTDKVFHNEKSPFYERVKTPVLDRSLPREKDPKSPFPTFMQDSIASRMSVGMLSQRALKINNFAEGRFQTVWSSFSPQKFT